MPKPKDITTIEEAEYWAKQIYEETREASAADSSLLFEQLAILAEDEPPPHSPEDEPPTNDECI